MENKKKAIILCGLALLLTTGCGKEVQIGKSGYTNEEILSFYNERYFDSYMEKVDQDCLKEYISEDDYNKANDEVESTMDELKTAYGDELEAAINYYTGQTTEQYKASYFTDLLKEKAALKYCDDEGIEEAKCNEYAELYTYYAVRAARKDAKLKFKDKSMNEQYEKYLESEDTKIKSLEDEMNGVGKENITLLTYDELEKKLTSKESFIMVVTQTTCGHCKNYAPVVNKVAGDKGIKIYEVDLLKLSAEEGEKFDKQFEVSGTPTTFFIKNGKEQTKMTKDGEVSEEVLSQLVDEFLK